MSGNTSEDAGNTTPTGVIDDNGKYATAQPAQQTADAKTGVADSGHVSTGGGPEPSAGPTSRSNQDTQAKEKEVAKELNDKYGSGNLDPETGVFTPNS